MSEPAITPPTDLRKLQGGIGGLTAGGAASWLFVHYVNLKYPMEPETAMMWTAFITGGPGLLLTWLVPHKS